MSKFRVLLVYPNLQMVNLLPSNVSILSACLRKADIDVKLFDTTFYRTAEKSVEDFRRLIDEYKPNLIGVTATDDTVDFGIELVSSVRHKDIFTIVGGVYPTFSPEEAIANENVDSICIGEGENALVELCLKLQANDDISDVKNLWVKVNGKIYKNGTRELVDINSIPYEDFGIFEQKRFFRPMQEKIYRTIPVFIDRGYPFGCTFCAGPFTNEFVC